MTEIAGFKTSEKEDSKERRMDKLAEGNKLSHGLGMNLIFVS